MALRKSLDKFIIKSLELRKKQHLKNFKILDCRWYLGNENKGKKEFRKSHIRGAIFFNINYISDKTNELPHMLPSKEQFASYISNFNIKLNDEIIIYDQCGYFSAARVWFMFSLFGFNKVRILDGGIKDWIKKKFPVTNKIDSLKHTSIVKLKKKNEMIINKGALLEAIKKPKDFHIIDARPTRRFLGIDKEPRPGLKKGNIKSSINIPFDSIQKKNNYLLRFYELNNLIKKKKITISKEIICYCGSGVTACNLILVLNIIGFMKVKLYDGSWAEWGKIK